MLGLGSGTTIWTNRNYKFMKTPGGLLSGSWTYIRLHCPAATNRVRERADSTASGASRIIAVCGNHGAKATCRRGGWIGTRASTRSAHGGQPCVLQPRGSGGSAEGLLQTGWASGVLFKVDGCDVPLATQWRVTVTRWAARASKCSSPRSASWTARRSSKCSEGDAEGDRQ